MMYDCLGRHSSLYGKDVVIIYFKGTHKERIYTPSAKACMLASDEAFRLQVLDSDFKVLLLLISLALTAHSDAPY
jgi:hypothetical protein